MVGVCMVLQLTGWMLVTEEKLQLRAYLPGCREERCKPFGRDRSQKLKKLLQESDISPWLRDRLPLIYVEEELAAVADLWVCDKFHTHPEEVGIPTSSG